MPFGQVTFPFAAELADADDLTSRAVRRTGTGPRITEEYRVDRHGLVEVVLANEDSGLTRTYRLGALGGLAGD